MRGDLDFVQLLAYVISLWSIVYTLLVVCYCTTVCKPGTCNGMSMILRTLLVVCYCTAVCKPGTYNCMSMILCALLVVCNSCVSKP